MSQTYRRKRGDTISRTFVLYNGNVPLDLTAATSVRIIARLPGAASPKFVKVITTGLDATGQLVFAPDAIDVDTDGTYDLEFEITWNTTKVETIPEDGYDQLVILKDLGGAA